MPVADYATYCAMLDRARAERFAYPAINVTSLTTANAVLKGLAESKSDGIIQVSTGGGAFASGAAVKDMALGAISIGRVVTLAGYPPPPRGLTPRPRRASTGAGRDRSRP